MLSKFICIIIFSSVFFEYIDSFTYEEAADILGIPSSEEEDSSEEFKVTVPFQHTRVSFDEPDNVLCAQADVMTSILITTGYYDHGDSGKDYHGVNQLEFSCRKLDEPERRTIPHNVGGAKDGLPTAIHTKNGYSFSTQNISCPFFIKGIQVIEKIAKDCTDEAGIVGITLVCATSENLMVPLLNAQVDFVDRYTVTEYGHADILSSGFYYCPPHYALNGFANVVYDKTGDFRPEGCPNLAADEFDYRGIVSLDINCVLVTDPAEDCEPFIETIKVEDHAECTIDELCSVNLTLGISYSEDIELSERAAYEGIGYPLTSVWGKLEEKFIDTFYREHGSYNFTRVEEILPRTLAYMYTNECHGTLVQKLLTCSVERDYETVKFYEIRTQFLDCENMF